MILPPSSPLAARSLNGTYYRAVKYDHSKTPASTAHTITATSRFSDGSHGYRLLYLTANPQTALLEVKSLIGSPQSDTGVVPYDKKNTWVMVSVLVDLRKVAYLTDLQTRLALSTNYQEMTGDWEGHDIRVLTDPLFFGSVKEKIPTQELGEYLFQSGFDGLVTVSAKSPGTINVIVFPDNLSASGGSYQYTDPITHLSVSVTS